MTRSIDGRLARRNAEFDALLDMIAELKRVRYRRKYFSRQSLIVIIQIMKARNNYVQLHQECPKAEESYEDRLKTLHKTYIDASRSDLSHDRREGIRRALELFRGTCKAGKNKKRSSSWTLWSQH